MRFQRIFWVLFFLFPNSVFAQTGTDAEMQSEHAKTSAVLNSHLKAIQAIVIKVPEIEPFSSKIPVVTNEFISTSSRAQTMCAESTSPAISSFLIKNGLTLQTLGTMASGFADECSNAGKMIGLANAAIGAFQAQCGTFQGICDSDVAKLSKSTAEYLAAANKAQTTYFSRAQTGDTTAVSSYDASVKHAAIAVKIQETTKNAVELCGKYKVKTEQAVTAGVLALGELLKSNKCKEQTAAKDGIDCNDKNNIMYNQKSCMCTRNELPAADCQNMMIGNNAGSGPEIAIGKSDGKLTGEGSPGELFGTAPSGFTAADSSGGAGLPGAPTGGSGSASAGGGGGGAQDGSTFKRRLNTNILGGEPGGGGGGGFGSGPGYGETDPSLKAYGPGGAKDANRVVASELTKQVTNPAGRSNWEKVKSRYTDNLRNLTGR